MFTNPAACDIFAFRVAWLGDSFSQDYCRSLGGSASVSVTLLSVSLNEEELQKIQKGEEGNILHFLENFNQCYTTNLAVFKRWSWEHSHSGCQGIDLWNHLGQKRPLRSSDHVFYRLTDERVLQKPLSARDASNRHIYKYSRYQGCENSNFIYGITGGMCLENKRVSPQVFWLWCLELQKERYDTLPQTLDLFFPGNRAGYH